MQKNEVTIEQWAVIRIEGAGHIEEVAHDRANAILRYCWRRISQQPSFDFEAWWKENSKKKHLVCQKIRVSTQHITGVPHPGWRRPTPKADRCEWDMGHATICAQQCEVEGKHVVEGHRLCGLHLKTYQRRGQLLLATKPPKA
ncbi:hypothetical protein [Diaphorobacter sp. J5-51]|uniref:hypothetical protein n=1 Tax=Diaphorobacter sp. J5-51 TaxID=680496 RepID=UPI0012F72269|nr:hypothetical protein [Diaphorobacter sp. J5-51]